jgi:uridine phosphorylase
MVQPHIHLSEELGVKYAILPGDPGRVSHIKEFLENAKEVTFNREYRSAVGTYKGVKVLALSTGMGGVSVGIALEELHNIGVEGVIRIGSAGALQEGIRIGDLILCEGAVREDGTSRTYVKTEYPAVADAQFLACVVEAAKEQGFPYHLGIAHSHESFYHDEAEEVAEYWSKKGCLGADCETAPLFTVARLRHMKAASILNNVVVWGEDTADAIGSFSEGEDMSYVGETREIVTALEAIVKLEERCNG